MFVEITREDDQLLLKLLHPRIDGSNHMLDAMTEFLGPEALGDNAAVSGLREIEIDFAAVNYLNSMGITELVNLYRMATDRSRGRIQFRFINVSNRIHSILELVEFTKLADVQKTEA
ncbi:MAG: STAS domain-containing protein [bacterium]|nr:STAS domain-containing protein [bacterium]